MCAKIIIIIYNQNYYTKTICSIFVSMKPLNEVGCPEMLLLVIPVILYGIWYNWKEKQKEEIVRKQNRNRERSSAPYPSRKGSESLEKMVPPHLRRPSKVTPVATPIPVATDQIVHNIAANPTDTTWFLCTHKDLPAPSSAEALIIEELEKYQIKWYREVSFNGLQFTLYSHPRFDFLLQLPDNKILIIEYDGRSAHSNNVQIATDKAKDKFCNDNGITIIRYNAKHYYNMYGHINSLMKSNGIKKKLPL